jgi:hypothetical protein
MIANEEVRAALDRIAVIFPGLAKVLEDYILGLLKKLFVYELGDDDGED